MSALTTSAAWRALAEHAAELESTHMRELFEREPQRSEHMTCSAAGLLLDYSKNRITGKTLKLLFDLARQAELDDWRARMFDGERINHTEDRAVLHIALRNRSDRPIRVDDTDIMPSVRGVQAEMRAFAGAVRTGQWVGYSGKPVTDVVNIGIGGSDLGPFMVCRALKPYGKPGLRMHFVSNVDGTHIHDTVQQCNPETTLFIVSSKSFSTQETLNNALAARAWFLDNGGVEKDIDKHFVAVTSNNPLATEFGISPDAQFEMWDWVGGRYSLWSAIGLPIAIYIGMDRYEELLDGAYAMDEHFRTAELERNMPVLLALLGVWYNNFLGFETHAVLPYIQHLASLPDYLQQADMESNGKCVDRDGNRVDYQTGPVIWGGTGTNAQHAFFQLMHQGTKPIPADFILAKQSHAPLDNQQRMLLANGLAQMEALMKGKTDAEVAAELSARKVPAEKAGRLTPYQVFEGNKPSNAVLMDKLTPQTLGALIALYEHKIFVQGVIWNINSFDQWGVEYGKQLAKGVLNALENRPDGLDVSSSTQNLIARVK
ncbi:MAG TPA: glucose-6-phosphate isomerase [Gammaproteobacteria bacterium]